MKKNLFSVFLPLVLLTSAVWGEFDPLPEDERKDMLEKLVAWEKSEKERITRTRRTAVAAFQEVLDDDEKTYDLYEKCAEKVLFTDQKKEPREFREWRKKQREREDTNEYRRALRHQLNWLLFLIKLSWEQEMAYKEQAKNAEKSNEETAEKNIPLTSDQVNRAVDRIDAVLEDGAYLKKQISLLQGSVTSSVFARAYELKFEKALPQAPLNLHGFYQQFALPPLKEKKQVTSYRRAYAKWISQEYRLIELRSMASGEGKDSLAFDKFALERRPQMLWDMEKTIYEMGEQEAAAKKMMAHLKSHGSHRNWSTWVRELRELLKEKSLVLSEEEGEGLDDDFEQ